jgi:nicotinate-nucleotide--dimethylbenzimidazole phosphoribosyltransferase
MPIPTVHAIADAALASRLAAAIDDKTKPPGSLGMLEDLALQLGLILRTVQPRIEKPALLVFAADHGIVAENVSPYPQSVTAQMVANFLAGGAAINVFARQNGCALQVVDAGVNHDFGDLPGLTHRKVAPGTRNFAREPAMSAAQCEAALAHGYALAGALQGNLLGLGEMGIGNTTSAAALMHKLTGLPLADCVGAGTGLDADGVRRKAAVIEAAVALHRDVTAPPDVLATFGGLEIAMMAGAMLKAAEQRMVLLIDGFIVSSALLVAARLQPAVLDYCVFAHCSGEHGHAQLLRHLGGRPLLRLGMRLGEGSGAALALPLVQAAAGFLCEMATFESAAVSNRAAGA